MMIRLLAIRSAATRLRAAPFTETPVLGAHSLIYRPGVEALPLAGDDATAGPRGTFARGLYRLSGVLFLHDGAAAEALFTNTDDLDLVIRYRTGHERRVRTFKDVLFAGDATVTIPPRNTGLPELVGVPFRLQIPEGETLADHVEDEADA